MSFFWVFILLNAALGADNIACSICYEDIHPIRTFFRINIFKTSCSHWFHDSCFAPWYDSKPFVTCPNCRRPVNNFHPSLLRTIVLMTVIGILLCFLFGVLASPFEWLFGMNETAVDYVALPKNNSPFVNWYFDMNETVADNAVLPLLPLPEKISPVATTAVVLGLTKLGRVTARLSCKNLIYLNSKILCFMGIETGTLNLYPNEGSIKILRDMETNEIFWKDPNGLLAQHAGLGALEDIRLALQKKGAEQSNAIFHSVSRWGFHGAEEHFLIKELLNHMAENINVNARGFWNLTPLMIAVDYDAKDAAAKLIRRGSDVKAADKIGVDVFSYARRICRRCPKWKLNEVDTNCAVYKLIKSISNQNNTLNAILYSKNQNPSKCKMN